MSAVSDVLEYRLSGGGGNANPDSSLGGAASATEIVNSTKENLFSSVSSTEVNNGSKKYRCIYLYNSGAVTLSGIGTWISTKTQSADTSIFIGVGTSSVGTVGTEQTIANEDAAPSGVTFTAPVSSSTPLYLPDLPANNYLPLWIRRDVTVGAEGAIDDYARLNFDEV